MAELIIECPKCKWKPDGGEYWMCSCGHTWNTFATAGRCPACSKQWNDTCCPSGTYVGGCGQWSPHLEWYKNLDDKLKKEIKEINKKIPAML